MEQSKSEDFQKFDLNPGVVKTLIDHLINLKKNIEEILKLKPEDNELSDVIKKN